MAKETTKEIFTATGRRKEAVARVRLLPQGEGKITVNDTQNGCFRFSAANFKNSTLPRQYESHHINEHEHYFTSCRFGEPGFGQLSETAPCEIKRGAENGSEIGAFCKLNNPVKFDSLKTKVEEYLPFGLIPIFIHET